MKNYFFFFLLAILFTSCQVTETIYLNADGSGSVEIIKLRDEYSYMLWRKGAPVKEETFLDTTFVFNDYIKKYNETVVKYTKGEQALFQKYKDAVVHIKQSSFDKEYKTSVTIPFNKIEILPNLYNTEVYADNLKNNHPLFTEYYDIQYNFDGTVFKRSVNIINAVEFQKRKDQVKDYKSRFNSLNLTQAYILKYNFPRKIKLVSNSAAILSSDKKSLTLTFQLLDCLENPEKTNLEVVLE